MTDGRHARGLAGPQGGPESRHDRWLASGRFGSLDGLRALSIIPVVWHHATPGPMPGILGRGPLGVDLFFVISGFLITTLLLRERAATGTVALGAFFVRRSLRIFPLYYLVLGGHVLHALLLRDHGPTRDHFLRSVPFYATYTSSWFVDYAVPYPVVFSFAWSLAAEEQFYLGFPWALRVTRGIALPALFMASMVVVDQAAERGWLGPLGLAPLALRILKSLATPIGLGALAAIAVWPPAGFRLLDALLGHRAIAPLALALLVIGAYVPWPLFPVQLVMTALVVACCLREDNLLAGFLRARPLAHVGTVSYGIYLVNGAVVFATRRQLPAGAPTWLVFALGLALAVAAATAAHRWIERPLFQLRERYRRGPSRTER